MTKINDFMLASPGMSIWLSSLAALILLAAYALMASLMTSMEILEFSIKIPWAGMVGTYVFLVAAGSGLCIINALGAVFGMHRYELMAKRMAFLSLTSIVFGMLCILLHLGRPERMPIYNAISPNFRSAISWMGVLYSNYLLFVTVELWLQVRPSLIEKGESARGKVKTLISILTLTRFNKMRLYPWIEDPRLPRLVGAMAFVFGASALSMLGSVFAHSESRLLWYGPYNPAYFVVSAIFCGFALLLATTIVNYRVRGDRMPPVIEDLIFEMARVLAVVLSIGLLMTTCRIAFGLYDPASRGPLLLLLAGPFKTGFWGFEVGVMSVGATVVLLWAAGKKSLNGVLCGALMVLIGAWVMRYQFVVAGQVFPNIPEGLPSYWPTLMEFFVLGGAMAAFLMTYTIGDWLLSFKENAGHHAN